MRNAYVETPDNRHFALSGKDWQFRDGFLRSVQLRGASILPEVLWRERLYQQWCQFRRRLVVSFCSIHGDILAISCSLAPRQKSLQQFFALYVWRIDSPNRDVVTKRQYIGKTRSEGLLKYKLDVRSFWKYLLKPHMWALQFSYRNLNAPPTTERWNCVGTPSVFLLWRLGLHAF